MMFENRCKIRYFIDKKKKKKKNRLFLFILFGSLAFCINKLTCPLILAAAVSACSIPHNLSRTLFRDLSANLLTSNFWLIHFEVEQLFFLLMPIDNMGHIIRLQHSFFTTSILRTYNKGNLRTIKLIIKFNHNSYFRKVPSMPQIPMPSTISLVSLNGTVSGVFNKVPCSNATPKLQK
ncbi:hypothetical protein AGLY_004764 [Aphis glycines]|uniref:Uncharacterized protein n=1 Tax=Aphis glycines TaxID=307491 RepID=A0A6G0TUW0_APHGL|nr:hypothetical protein AGLY_004764 [Aphis glycines]